MAYIEGRTVHDAEAHVMELPDKILEYLAPSAVDAFIKAANKPITVSQDLQKAITLCDYYRPRRSGKHICARS